MSAYETVLDSIIDALEDAVVATDEFTADSTHFSYVRREDYGDYNPIALLSLINDTITAIGPMETRHLVTFRVRISYQATGTKANLNDIVSYVGQIVDQIESDRTMGTNFILNTEVTGVEYSQNAPPNFVIYYAFMEVQVEALRNV